MGSNGKMGSIGWLNGKCQVPEDSSHIMGKYLQT